MITPKFWLDQNEEFLTISIFCPLIKREEVEHSVSDNVFYFYSKPYFLRLTFQNRFALDGRETGKYDIGSSKLIFNIPKLNRGEIFCDLDLLTKLLEVQETTIQSGIIEEVDSCSESEPKMDLEGIFHTQHLNPENALTLGKYGFNNYYHGYFYGYPRDILSEIIQLPDPETSTEEDRKLAEYKSDIDKFDDEHYMYDWMDEDSHVKNILSIGRPFGSGEISFTDGENKQMLSLRTRRYILDNPKSTYYGLVDILNAYCYNRRVTEGENSVESPWNIAMLSSTLSWFRMFDHLEDVVHCFVRKSLAYPLYRNWQLSLRTIGDTVYLLSLGKRAVLKVMLETKRMFDYHEHKYVLSKLYLNDYCVWIQNISDEVLQYLSERLEKISLDKCMFPWRLEELETTVQESL